MNVAAIPGFSEPFSAISHLVSAIVFLVLSFRLLPRANGNLAQRVTICIYAFSVVFLLSMSGVYHLLELDSSSRVVLQRLDHAGIFLLIAGTFTPVHTILFRGFWRWGFLTIIWSLAITGLTLKTVFFNEIEEWQGLIFYIGLGWLGIVSGVLTHKLYGYKMILPLLYGAIAYTIGAVLDFLRYPVIIPSVIGPHELFHIAVITGIACHWRFIHNLLAVRID